MAKLIELIKELNTRTGAGLMDCKKALLENNEDIEKAIDWLREKGIAKQSKKESRIAAEGLTEAYLSSDNRKAVIIEINSETDFVANSDPFRNLIKVTAEIILKNGYKTIDQVKADKEYETIYNESALKLGEKLSLRRFELIEAKADTKLGFYVHMKGKIAVVVEVKGDEAVIKNLAMNIAAYNPTFATVEDIDAETRSKETEIQTKLAHEDASFGKKPAQIQEKIITGRVDKVLCESVLSHEMLITIPELTVADYLKQNNTTVVKFVRYAVGEGIEKRVDNFADEVMSQANNK